MLRKQRDLTNYLLLQQITVNLKKNNKLVEDAEFMNYVSNEDSPYTYIQDIVQLTPSMNATNTPNGYANIAASQYTKLPLKFAVLTNFGIVIYQFRTADQILKSLKDEVIENFLERKVMRKLARHCYI